MTTYRGIVAKIFRTIFNLHVLREYPYRLVIKHNIIKKELTKLNQNPVKTKYMLLDTNGHNFETSF